MKKRTLEGEIIYCLSRRDFIKLCGTSSVGLFLVACGYQSDTLTSPQPLTGTPTATQAPTLTPTASVTPTATQTPVMVESGGWGVYTEGEKAGLVDPRVMFPLVGAIDKKHHTIADYIYNGLRIAISTDTDLIGKNADDQLRIKSELLDNISQNNDLKKLLDAIIERNGTDYIRVLIEKGVVTQVVKMDPWKKGEIDSRNRVNSKGILTKLAPEEEPQLLPLLQISGKEIIRADTGEIIQLQGITIDRGPIIGGFSHDSIDMPIDIMETAKSWGSNFVRIYYATDLARSKIDDFIRLAHKAQELGLYIAFTADSKSAETWADVPIPTNSMIEDIAYLASVLKDQNNVLFDIWSDPYTESETVYNNAIVGTLNALRGQGVKTPIIIPGFFWGKSFVELNLKRLSDHNVIFRPYFNPWEGQKSNLGLSENQDIYTSRYNQSDKWDFLLDPNRVPFGAVMLGEFGFPGDSPLFNSDRDAQWQKHVIELITEKKLSFTQYEGLSSYRNWIMGERKPNSIRGHLILDLFAEYPPYQFDQ